MPQHLLKAHKMNKLESIKECFHKIGYKHQKFYKFSPGREREFQSPREVSPLGK